MVNPLRARLFAEACGVLAKTDAIDARMLALMGAQLEPAVTPPPSQTAEALDELTRARASAIDERVAISNRHGVTATAFLRCELSRKIRALDTHIDRLETEIDRLIASDPVLAAKYAILLSIPGIGAVTAAALTAGLGELGQLDSRQIAALVGLAPIACDSGPRKGHRRIRGGRSHLRKPLYMAAMAAVRSNPDLSRFHQRLQTNGKPFKVAITAVMRKLLVLANSLIAQNRQWSPVPA